MCYHYKFCKLIEVRSYFQTFCMKTNNQLSSVKPYMCLIGYVSMLLDAVKV